MTPEKLAKLRIKCERSLYWFAKIVFGYDKLTDTLHKPVCEWLTSIPPRRKCLLMPRDHYKTSIAQALVAHIIIQPQGNNIYWPGEDGSNLRILYAAETDETAKKRIGLIQRHFESNELLRAMWPEKVWHDSRDARDWSITKFTLPRSKDYPESTVEISGVGTAVTGRHYNVKIEDDLIGQRARDEITTTMPATIEWYKASEALMDPPMNYLEFIFGTRWAHYDLYSWMQENDSSVQYMIRKVIEDGKPLFPELMNMEYIESLRQRKGELFYLNYMNEVTHGTLNAFDMTRLRFYDIENDVINFDVLPPESLHLPTIEETEKVEDTPVKIKKHWELTPQERVDRWNQKHQDWRKEREMRRFRD